MNWYIEVLKKYAVFKGRARRKEYWFFVLFSILIGLVFGLIDGLVGTFDSDAGMGVISAIYALAVLIPSIAVGVRRLHDTGRAGWWLLIALIPFIGPIVLIIFLALDGHPDENKYGPNPKTESI